MKKKSMAYYVALLLFTLSLVILLFFKFIPKQPKEAQNTLLISPYTDYLLMFDPESSSVAGNIKLEQQSIVRKILRYEDSIYVIAVHQLILLDSVGKIKKIVYTNDTLVDGIVKDGKLFIISFIQLPGVSCNSSNISKGYKSYLTIFDLNLSQLSKLEFNQSRFSGFTSLNNNFFVSSFFDSKVYKIEENEIIKEIQLPQESFLSQVLSFDNELVVIGKKEIFAIPTDLSTFKVLMNETTCDYFVKAFIYNDKLYATCFTGNKTIVYDLLQNKLVKQINTTLPFYVWGFKDKIYVTSAFAKKLYVIDPNTNELIATIDFDEPPRVIG
jgi:YVTN family beta-propeller protein